MDIANACQNTILTTDKIAHVCPLPFYVEWFRSRFPRVLVPREVQLVAQATNTIQSTKTVGKLWNDRLNAVLEILEIKM